MVEQRSRYDSEGAYVRIIEYDDTENTEYDRILVRAPPEDPNTLAVTCYDGDEIVHQDSFENRDLQFDPISVMGRGQSNRLQGTSPNTDSYEDVPRDVMVALNGLGLAVVPEGEWWL